jgi:soluble lytic murein transglycosylase-like protein
MKKVILLLMFIPSIAFGWEHRLDDDGYHRTSELISTMDIAAKQADVPRWLVAGIIYNESNSYHHAMGDGGRAYGLGQIHCGPGGFSWMKFLNNHGYTDCKDLLVPTKNIIAVSIILKYLKTKMKNPNDYLLLVTMYHKGENYKTRSKGYYQRVKWFGRKIVERKYQFCLGEI